MSLTGSRIALSSSLILGLLAGYAPAADALENERVRVEFDASGIAAVVDKTSGESFAFGQDTFVAVVDGETIRQAADGPARFDGQTRTSSQTNGPLTIETVYELKPGWRFVTKQLVITSTKPSFKVNRLDVLRSNLTETLSPARVKRFVAFLRPTQTTPAKSAGVFFTLQNPFPQWKFTPGHASIGYVPEMTWASMDGPFESDRLCIGTTTLSGGGYALPLVPEWKWVPPAEQKAPTAYLDRGELIAMNDCVRAFLMQPRDKSVRVQVGWCVNDYQIDIATPDGRAQYKRIMDRAADMGNDYQLFTPTDSTQSKLADNTDAWGWENVLWFGMGQKQRQGTWDPHTGPLPPGATEVLDHAKARGIKPLAYVYPTLNYPQDPTWTDWIKTIKDGKPGGYRGVDTGVRSYQDWIVDQMVGFYRRGGVGGFSFDHWWIAYDEATSKYTQWYGCRRILEELRKKLPNVLIDGRQQYQHFGPWTWLAGTYPHPTGTDEQPLSFKAFPDLHIDRVSADRQRYSAWWFRVLNDCPPELMPGFITHQTPREDAKDVMRRDTFRTKDWDVLGWKYSLISSIATAPFNHVINMIPARDEQEYAAFSKADQKWCRDWLDWTDRNLDLLRDVRPILGQPMLGRVDGTAAFKGDRGAVFLFNPNYRRTRAEFKFDDSIGLTSDKPMIVRQLYPDAEKGRLLPGPSGGHWRRGDTMTLDLPGTDALVLDVSAAPENADAPQLFGVAGDVKLNGDRLILDGVQGPVGQTRAIEVRLPSENRVGGLTVNGVKALFTQTGRSVKADLRFDGVAMDRTREVGFAAPANTGGSYAVDLVIPARVVDQLRRRRAAWPVTYTADDLEATWLGSDRLLMFVNVAEANDKMQVSLKINGRAVPLKPAYTSIYARVTEHTFVGWYADVSTLETDRPHKVDLTLPTLKPGQFQGVFLENVETELTGRVVGQNTK